jgi:hypothetical protein
MLRPRAPLLSWARLAMHRTTGHLDRKRNRVAAHEQEETKAIIHSNGVPPQQPAIIGARDDGHLP